MKRKFIFTTVLLLLVLASVNALASAATSVTFTQLTNTSGGFIFGPSLSANAQLITFDSDMDLVPGQNVAGDIQIFLMNTNGTGLVQLTHVDGGLGGRSGSSLSANGKKVAFHSNRDLVAGQNTDGNFEIFLIGIDGTGLVQLTDTTGALGNFSPSLSASGKLVSFDSDRDRSGQNPDENREIFLMNIDGTGLVQLTETTDRFSFAPSLRANGQQVAFSSSGDLVSGQNTDGNREIFLINADGTGLVQLTDTTVVQSYTSSLSASGIQIAFSSTADFVGNNPDGNFEIFLAMLGP